jgi:isopenicillin-N N-acyltransferase-like protein
MYRFDPGKFTSSRDFGREHGESFRSQIKEIAEIRMMLACDVGGFDSPKTVIKLAEAHLPLLKSFAPDLSDEIWGISEGADCSIGDIILLNHYTDLRDIGPNIRNPLAPETEGGCTAIFARTETGPVLAQTWDMHASATPYTLMIHVPEQNTPSGVKPEAWVMSMTGCVGMAGMSRTGVALTINNLRCTDAHIGIIWPVLVRKLLQTKNAKTAYNLLMDAPLGSGHHYFIADDKQAYGVEASGTQKRTVYDGQDSHFLHTNHCFDQDIEKMTSVTEGSTTWSRYDRMHKLVTNTPPDSPEKIWSQLGAEGVCIDLSSKEDPHNVATCSAVLMNIAQKEVWSRGGCFMGLPPEISRFQFTEGDTHE